MSDDQPSRLEALADAAPDMDPREVQDALDRHIRLTRHLGNLGRYATEYAQALDTLDTDDQHTGRRRDNTSAAADIARRRTS